MWPPFVLLPLSIRCNAMRCSRGRGESFYFELCFALLTLRHRINCVNPPPRRLPLPKGQSPTHPHAIPFSPHLPPASYLFFRLFSFDFGLCWRSICRRRHSLTHDDGGETTNERSLYVCAFCRSVWVVVYERMGAPWHQIESSTFRPVPSRSFPFSSSSSFKYFWSCSSWSCCLSKIKFWPVRGNATAQQPLQCNRRCRSRQRGPLTFRSF